MKKWSKAEIAMLILDVFAIGVVVGLMMAK